MSIAAAPAPLPVALGADPGPTESCLYEGAIRHRRRQPATQFTHRLVLAYLDLGELPSLLGGRLAQPAPGLLRFRRRDYLPPAQVALDRAVGDRVVALGGEPPAGPIRVLTQLRSWGLCFNPVSFYYCFDRDGQRLRSVLAEVTNTPWGERHSYLLSAGEEPGAIVRGQFDKALHVSPFMGMDQRYEARATVPGQTLAVHIESARAGETVFDATLSLQRRALTPASARRLSLRYPFATARVLALIYGHALGLKLAGARVHAHPRAEQAR